jgi:hypothetical protein
VILLKAPSQDQRDPYREPFRDESSVYAVLFLSLRQPGGVEKHMGWRIVWGVIVTSARASEAWKTVVQSFTWEGVIVSRSNNRARVIMGTP